MIPIVEVWNPWRLRRPLRKAKFGLGSPWNGQSHIAQVSRACTRALWLYYLALSLGAELTYSIIAVPAEQSCHRLAVVRGMSLARENRLPRFGKHLDSLFIKWTS
jgi:hypothetical protein